MEVQELQIEKNDKDAQCFVKAKSRKQPTFTLVAQDRSAPRVIAEWIKLNIETAPTEKLRGALEAALDMRAYSPRRAAD